MGEGGNFPDFLFLLISAIFYSLSGRFSTTSERNSSKKLFFKFDDDDWTISISIKLL